MVSVHLDVGPRLVEENQPLGIEVELRIEPGLPLLQDVWSALAGQFGLQLAQGHVSLRLEHGLNGLGVAFGLVGQPVATAGPRCT